MTSVAPGSAHAYAGIGSRETPAEVLALMEALAERLGGESWLLRTGLSPGADQAFYRGALLGGGEVELYLPWPGFEADARLDIEGASVRELPQPSAAACELARRFHEGWDALEPPARQLLARDAHEVLGADLRSPAELLVCWTADGSLDGEDLYEDGTGEALRIASEHRIPVLNLARREDLEGLVGL
ncbi:MAG TPA: hypothetical protein VGO14_10020 [Solirubrobacteraceae bacterium]|jgi:hypothetical protein|nr:hypothetical protein [Solirubrobacteraceae bacterium]